MFHHRIVLHREKKKVKLALVIKGQRLNMPTFQLNYLRATSQGLSFSIVPILQNTI